MQAVPYFDRLDYVSPMCEEHAFALAVEKLLGIEVPERGQWIRVLFAEITRVLNHLLNLTTYALDVGAITPSLWGFEEREKLMEFHEAASGARLHANYFRPGGVSKDLPAGLEDRIADWAETLPEIHRRPGSTADRQPHLEAAHRRYRRDRSPRQALAWGFSGPLLRASGVPWDLRRVAALRQIRRGGVRDPGRAQRRLLRPLSGAHGRDAREREDHQAVPGEDEARAGEGAGPQVLAADARRDEALDGSADPSLQALYRGLSRAGRRDLHRGGKRRRASSASIWSPTAPTGPIAARSARPASPSCRRSM